MLRWTEPARPPRRLRYERATHPNGKRTRCAGPAGHGWSPRCCLPAQQPLAGCAREGGYKRTPPSRYAGTWQDRAGRELPDDHPSSEGFALLSYDGARHCDAESVTFLSIAWPPGRLVASIDAPTVRQYVRDPYGAYRQVRFRGSFAATCPCPRTRAPPATTTAPTPCGSARPTPTATCTSKAPTGWNAGLARPSRSTAPDRTGERRPVAVGAWPARSTMRSTFCFVLPVPTLTAGLPELRWLARTALGFRPASTDLAVGGSNPSRRAQTCRSGHILWALAARLAGIAVNDLPDSRLRQVLLRGSSSTRCGMKRRLRGPLWRPQPQRHPGGLHGLLDHRQ
jgi:hypothetical protein